ncbi:signal peptidase I [Halomonas sp. E19]|jgi:conjugal transfer pilin signal peptidase TrbI|uniref:signal peptidase I n=1 Tax=Halomonas sp. E19 TaxID=3397247 RepID=UPI0040348696
MSKRERQSTPRFVAKMGVVATLIFATGYAFVSRYHFGIDSQEVKCIGDYSLFLVDRHDKDLQRGNIYAFSAQGVEPYFDEGTQMVKILRGLPGDHVRITESGDVFVNDELVGEGLILAEEVGANPADFAGETILEEGSYWFMGETPYSFDSRYWGTVSEEQIIGQARPII